MTVEWIKVAFHYVTDEERERENISSDISYYLDCKLPDDEEEILIVRKWKDKYIVTPDTCIIDDGYSLDSGTEWTDVVAWMPIPKYEDIDDNVCEWESPVDIMDNVEFKVQCNHNPLIRRKVPNNFSFQDFRFCPFCGRKIVWK